MIPVKGRSGIALAMHHRLQWFIHLWAHGLTGGRAPHSLWAMVHFVLIKGKASPYSIAKRRVPELIPVLGSQRVGDVNHELGGRLLLLPARPAVTLATLKRAATNFAAW